MKHWKWIVKISVTLLLLYLVSLKIDSKHMWDSVRHARSGPLLAAFLLYGISRILGAHRLRKMLNILGIFISAPSNLRFYWVSMFYGMFLPGGLGGDAYKVFYLKKRYPDHSTINLTKVILWDRIIGFGVLVLMALLTTIILFLDPVWALLWIPAVIIQMLVLRWAIRRWIPSLLESSNYLLGVSIFIQLSQIAAIIALMNSIGLNEKFLEYALLFLVSSITSTLPITVGGVGIRELTFLYGSQFLHTSREYAVASGFLFDVIITAMALTGSLFVFQKNLTDDLKNL